MKEIGLDEKDMYYLKIKIPETNLLFMITSEKDARVGEVRVLEPGNN